MNVNTYILPFSFSSARFFIIKSFNEENIFKVSFLPSDTLFSTFDIVLGF